MNEKESPVVDNELKEDADLEVNGPINQCVLAALEVEGASEKAKRMLEWTGGSLGVGENVWRREERGWELSIWGEGKL